jgi:energy-coupling factor transport system permease protein
VFGAEEIFGRYRASDSRLHRLDPRIRLLVFALFTAAVFLASGWYHLLALTVYLMLLSFLAKTGPRDLLGTLKYFAWMFALTFAVNLLFPRRGEVPAMSYAALNLAAVFSSRLALMVLAATLVTMVTSPSEIGDSFLVLSRFGGRPGRLAADGATMLAITLRFVPVMLQEAERIRAAQKLRGMSPRSLGDRARSVVDLIVPLLESSLRRADHLSFALEARCYGYRVPRSASLRLGRAEVIFACSGLAMLIALVLTR